MMAAHKFIQFTVNIKFPGYLSFPSNEVIMGQDKENFKILHWGTRSLFSVKPSLDFVSSQCKQS